MMPKRVRPRLLFVDDDVNLLAGMTATLRKRFELVTAKNGSEGLKALAEQGPFTIVVSDFRMPGMDGAEMLRRAKDLAPDTVRILLTGHATLEDAVHVVNQANIFRLLTKPCAPDVLFPALQDAVEQARILTADRVLLQEKLESMSDALLRAEWLSTVATLAAAVGHEVNNAVGALQIAVHLVSAAAAEGRPPDPEYLDTLRCATEQLSVHGRHLLELGKPQAPEEVQTDLCGATTDALQMLRGAGLLRQASLDVDIPKDPIPVLATRIAIEQVVVNLTKNALDAVAEVGGRAAKLKVSIRRDPESRLASCRVEDNGCGIPKDRLPHIFEPYFTTKPRDRGTGLGLFVIKQIVEKAHGRIDVTSHEDLGTCFTLFFQASEGARALAS